MEKYYTIYSDVQSEITEKKSKFIANMYKVESVEQAEEKIKNIKKKYFDAKHHCIAYRVQDNNQILEKFSDDGEPSGTAGAPMLTILQKNNLCNVVVIVTRYFGGILLGTGGLVRAYSDVTINAIKESILVEKVEGVQIKLKTEYANLEIFKYYCKKNNIKIIKTDYQEEILIKIELEKNKKNIFFKDIENKKIKNIEIIEIEERYIEKNVE